MKTSKSIDNALFSADGALHLASHLRAACWQPLKLLLTLFAGQKPEAGSEFQSLVALRMENARIRRLYKLAVTELDENANAHVPTGRAANELRDYVEDRVRTRTAVLAAQIAELAHWAHTDHLTGLPNRRAFLQGAQLELARIQRNGQSACLVLGDIDHFKAFNDCCGHAAGDRVLQIVSQRLRTGLRAADTVARWGGEEFIMLLPETELLGAQRVAEKCRFAIQNGPVVCLDQETNVTMTFGVSVIGPSGCIDAAIARADEALYTGKNTGRNQVVSAAPFP